MAWTKRQWIAPAKVNLTLHITGKRENGYHELDSLVVFTNTGDCLEVTPSSSFKMHVSGPFATCVNVHGNSVIEAVKWFEEWSGKAVGLTVSLEKNLPVAAGLGGGTSDCATMIRALCEIYEVPLPAPETLLELGADVPVCFYGQACRMRGIGEILSPVALGNDYVIVMINPLEAVSTKAIFGSDLLMFSVIQYEALDDEIMKGRNDLQRAAVALCPAIGERLKGLAETEPLISRMSGSGATCFGLYENQERAHKAEVKLRGLYPHDWISTANIG